MSAIIMLVIVAMWAAVLGPMWMRRHDAVYESRSVDKFSAAMRVLSRRPRSAPGASVWGRSVMMPARPVEVTNTSPVSVSGRAGDTLRDSTPNDALFRLRRNVGALILIDVFTLAIWAGVGGTPVLMLHLAGDAVTAVALVGLQKASERERLRVAREARRRRVAKLMAHEQQAVAATAPRTHTATPVWHDPLSKRPSTAALARAAAEADRAAVEAAGAAGAAEHSDEDAAQDAAQEAAQEKARRRAARLPATSTTQLPRTIDLTVPGAWRESVGLDDVDDEVREAAMISGDADLDAELEAILERRRRASSA